MSTVPAVSSPAAATAGSSSVASSIATSNEESGDRFLKLLVTQLKNQDPMNPMDNAQLTSQMAQINTVAGIEKLNTSVGAMADRLSAQLMNSQALQGAGMVGRQVWTGGTTLSVEGGKGVGAFELPRAASEVTVDVLSSSGAVIGKVDLGAQASGRRTFQWSVPEGTNPSGLSFRVNALSGKQPVQATPQSADRVTAVTAGPDGLVLQLSRQGTTPVSNVKAWS
ncbi:MAG: flagellar hook capping FlgD N-terminal domain-containing protein [Betaproteobacteria bacterium]|jgi:flagellar basal-body rod modification protein FlgD